MSESNLRKYESVLIFRPNLDDESIDKAVQTVEEFIKSHGGDIITSDKKGRKRLSYEVKKMKDGFFVNLRYEVKPEAVALVRRMIGLSEDIIRSITTTLDEIALTAVSSS